VATWRFEVWNEPNLDGFWTHGDQAEYFHLYDVTVKAIKKVDADLLVGGPATAGAASIQRPSPTLARRVFRSISSPLTPTVLTAVFSTSTARRT